MGKSVCEGRIASVSMYEDGGGGGTGTGVVVHTLRSLCILQPKPNPFRTMQSTHTPTHSFRSPGGVWHTTSALHRLPASFKRLPSQRRRRGKKKLFLWNGRSGNTSPSNIPAQDEGDAWAAWVSAYLRLEETGQNSLVL